MSKVDELRAKNENLFERNTILLNENERLKKENADLERKLEQTEKDLADYQFNYPSIKELEQENNKLLDVINNQDVKIADLEKENAELPSIAFQQGAEWYKKKADMKLTKATELLKEAQGYIENEDDELYDKIEQFLKEIEK